MLDAEYTAEMAAADKPATLESVAIVERIRAIAEADRTEDEVGDLFRNEGHIRIKMAFTKFVDGLTDPEKAQIEALNL
tara:strand:- start:475 stop:708 length:234 start_codon:yes stop_codon:yes gene_type:complete